MAKILIQKSTGRYTSQFPLPFQLLFQQSYTQRLKDLPIFQLSFQENIWLIGKSFGK